MGISSSFQYCLNPNYPHEFLYLRAIQGHSGSTVNLALQGNVLLPGGFTEYIYHVGNGEELRSIVNHGFIPGGVSLTYEFSVILMGRHIPLRQLCEAIALLQSTLKEGRQA